MVDSYFLELSETELLDVELAIILALDHKKKEGLYKQNLRSVQLKIKKLQEDTELNLLQYC